MIDVYHRLERVPGASQVIKLGPELTEVCVTSSLAAPLRSSARTATSTSSAAAGASARSRGSAPQAGSGALASLRLGLGLAKGREASTDL